MCSHKRETKQEHIYRLCECGSESVSAKKNKIKKKAKHRLQRQTFSTDNVLGRPWWVNMCTSLSRVTGIYWRAPNQPPRWPFVLLHIPPSDKGQQFVALVESWHDSGWVAVPCVWLGLLLGWFIIHARVPRRSKTNKHGCTHLWGETLRQARAGLLSVSEFVLANTFALIFHRNTFSHQQREAAAMPSRAASGCYTTSRLKDFSVDDLLPLMLPGPVWLLGASANSKAMHR